MKVAVIGLWHLGLVTAGSLAKIKHQVIAYDPDNIIIENLQKNISPIQEPDLDDLLAKGVADRTLVFTHDPNKITNAEIVWVTFDTPVDEDDQADVAFVINEFFAIASFIQDQALVLFSSQLPVGSIGRIRKIFSNQYPNKNVRFCCVPENLRLGKAIQVFTKPDRFVIGLQDQSDRDKIKQLLDIFTDNFVWMSIESAEMTKHALNAFLAVSVTFINEIATLSEAVGADAHEVEAGLKSEERIGIKAYLHPGNAIAGGTLLRDIQYLNKLGEAQHHPVPLLSAVQTSNIYHKQWVHRKLIEQLHSLQHKTITMLGLTYKANTNTLRRSSALETCAWLIQQGAKVKAYDPAIQILPDDYKQFIDLKLNIQDALHTADAIVLATEWPDFFELEADTILNSVNQPLVLDPSGFLMSILSKDTRIRYYTVGRNS